MDLVLGLIDDIYEAGAHPEHWQAVLTRMANALGTGDATMGGATASQVPMLITARTDPSFVSTYAQYYHARNPMQLAVYRQPVGRPVLDTMMVDMDQFRGSEFYNDWCMPQGYLWGSAVNLAAAGGWRATIMLSGPQETSAEDFRLFSALSPHLCRAFQLNQLLHETQAVAYGVMAALEHVERGALVMDRNGSMRAANAMAERILGQDDGLRLSQGRLLCTDRHENAALQRILGDCQRGGIEGSGNALNVSRGPGRSPLSLLCVPFPQTTTWPGFEQHTTIIFISDPDARLERQSEKLREKFGLTPAEAALAWEIAKTGGRKSAAASRGVSVSTARTQLSSIFDKTGVRRQAELVRLLLENLDRQG